MRLSRLVVGALATLVISLLQALSCASIGVAAPNFDNDVAADRTLPGGSIEEIRAGQQEGFDRLIIEFEEELSSYIVTYVPQLLDAESGEPVPVEGAAFIQLDLIDVPEEPEAPQGTVTPELPGIVQLVGTGAVDGSAHYGIGTAEAAGFRVLTMTEPSRLIIDVAHPGTAPAPEPTPTATEQPAPVPTLPELTPVQGLEEEPDSPNSWLIYVVGGLAGVAVLAGLIGWRANRSRPPPRRRGRWRRVRRRRGPVSRHQGQT